MIILANRDGHISFTLKEKWPITSKITTPIEKSKIWGKSVQHTIPLFIDAGVLPLKFLYYEILPNLMFEIRHRNAPGNIQDLFQDISDIHSYNTRSSVSNNFYTRSSRLSIQVNSFSRIGRKIWNEMPMSLRKAVFKRKRKQILFWNSSFRRLLHWSTSYHSKSKAEFIFLLVCIINIQQYHFRVSLVSRPNCCKLPFVILVVH